MITTTHSSFVWAVRKGNRGFFGEKVNDLICLLKVFFDDFFVLFQGQEFLNFTKLSKRLKTKTKLCLSINIMIVLK
jgi:hypothetical protein